MLKIVDLLTIFLEKKTNEWRQCEILLFLESEGPVPGCVVLLEFWVSWTTTARKTYPYVTASEN